LLVMGPQVLNLVTIPKSFGGFSGAMIRFILCALVFGGFSAKKLIDYGDYIMVLHSVYGMQLALGVFVGIVCEGFWNTLPAGWGYLAAESFHGGHGRATAAGNVFKGVTSISDYIDIGLVLSTFGIIIAMTVGMVVVNWGVRKGYAAFVKDVAIQPDYFYGGLLPEEKQVPIGTQKITGTSVNALALQMGFILASMWVGELIGKLFVFAFPVLKGVALLAWDTVGGIAGWYVVKLFGMTKFVDKKTINQLAGLALEVLLVGAMATLNVKVLVTNIVPLLIITVIICLLTIVWTLFMAKMTCRDQWFEKAAMIIGCATGATPTGLALVRAIDPNSQSCAAEAHGVYCGVTFWIYFFTSILPPLLAVGSNTLTYVVGLLQFVIPVLIGFLVFRPIKLKAERAAKEQK